MMTDTDIIIIDDVVDKETQDQIESSIFSKDTKWTFARTIFYNGINPEVNEKQKNSLMSFTNLKMDLDKKLTLDASEKLYSKPLQNLNVKTLFQIRAQLQLPILTEKDMRYGIPHTDGREIKYTIGVYYVNDSDGDTVIFKQTTHDTKSIDLIADKLEILTSISPKKGRLVLFDGSRYHAVGKPKKDIRCILNYHFI
jgi:hypothetical protein